MALPGKCCSTHANIPAVRQQDMDADRAPPSCIATPHHISSSPPHRLQPPFTPTPISSAAPSLNHFQLLIIIPSSTKGFKDILNFFIPLGNTHPRPITMVPTLGLHPKSGKHLMWLLQPSAKGKMANGRAQWCTSVVHSRLSYGRELHQLTFFRMPNSTSVLRERS